MNNKKKLLAAGIVKDIWFASMKEFEIYTYGLDHRGTEYYVMETFERNDGTVLARIVSEYQTGDLINLR